MDDCLAAFNFELNFFIYNVTVVCFVVEMFHVIYFIILFITLTWI